ncbi:hypothetical protein P4388_32280, partial [Bacillus thuringiensis]|nr:hypothetical protein [Bacillus thuringiensis]
MSIISGEVLLSKIIEENNVEALKKHGIKRTDFQTETEQKAYDFITSYSLEYGESPSFTAVISSIPEFNFHTDVTDSFDYISKRLKEKKLQADAENYLTKEALPDWGKVAPEEWINSTTEKLKRLVSEN